MKSINNLLFIFLINISLGFSQETIGLLYQEDDAYDGYTLFTPEKNNSTYLIDNCGRTINTWTFSELPGLTCYLLENGNLLRAGKTSLEIRDWDNNLVWSFDLSTQDINQHHDIEPLPNGNILCITKEFITTPAQENLGKNPAFIEGNLRSEKIIEIEPIGTNNMNIVWEWRFVDHLIQDFDATAPTYGVVEDHPELVDFNYEDDNMNHTDWLHINSIDYNVGLDQIIMSSKSLGEIYIIDHSTTTAEASGHTGGNSGKGGDFLWRWGNPEVYRQGTTADRKLFEQHDAKWVETGYVNENQISVFNNFQDAAHSHSSLHLLTPELDTNNQYLLDNNSFLPNNFSWSWNGSVLEEIVVESKKCGVQSLPNGHILFCETSIGRLTELDTEGNIVWIYRNPSGSIIHDQMTTNAEILTDNSIFRGEKYPKDYPGFIGKDVTPGHVIEDVNANSDTCITNLSVNDLIPIDDTISIYNPVRNNTLRFNRTLENINYTLYSVSGSIVHETKSFSGNNIIIPNIKTGLYFMVIGIDNSKQEVIKVMVQ